MSAVTFDAVTADELNGVLGKKWTTFPGKIGAFIAEMDFQTAPVVQDALRKAVDAGFFGYVPFGMFAELSEATANWYREEIGWDIPVERIHALPEVLAGLELTLQHFSRAGSKIIIPTPAYMPFLSIPAHYGREVIQVPMIVRDGRWEYDYDAIDAAFADGGGVLIFCNPFNPIGRVMTREEMVTISEIVDRHHGRVFSDEIHSGIVFEGHQHIPYASISDVTAGHTITAVAATKAWNIAGLKCAQIVITNDADEEIWQQIAPGVPGPSTLGVVGSIVAYNEGRPWLKDVVSYLDGNRKALAAAISEHLPGAKFILPEGTYLGWIDFTQTGLDGDLAEFFRDRADVAITDGSACGKIGERSVRFNFATPRPLMEQAIAQMGEAIASI